MKVIIAGGRHFNNYTLLRDSCDKILKSVKEIEIVSGGAMGADVMGEIYAENRSYKITRFPANWKDHGKAAGPIRNKQMAEYADALIAFWDGKSAGTKNMIEAAKYFNLKVRVIKY